LGALESPSDTWMMISTTRSSLGCPAVPNTPKAAEAEDATTATTNGRGTGRTRRFRHPRRVRRVEAAARSREPHPARRSAPSEALVEGKTVVRSRSRGLSPLLATDGPPHQRASAPRERRSKAKENLSRNPVAFRTALARLPDARVAEVSEGDPSPGDYQIIAKK